MKRIILTAGAVIILAVFGWLTARFLPPGVVSKREEMPLSPIPAFHAKSKIRQTYPADSRELNQADGQPQGDTLPARRPRENVFSSKGPGKQPQGNYAPDALTQIKVFEDILQSQNDNDPRLDRDFNDLSTEAKRLFRRKYSEIPPEHRNERGIIVYLLGKNLNSAEDWAFLRSVASEPPCLSLIDCAHEVKYDDGHRALGIEVTLAYPHLVALKQAERVLEEARSASTGGKGQGALPTAAAREAMSVIQSAKNSKIPAVEKAATEIERRF